MLRFEISLCEIMERSENLVPLRYFFVTKYAGQVNTCIRLIFIARYDERYTSDLL